MSNGNHSGFSYRCCYPTPYPSISKETEKSQSSISYWKFCFSSSEQQSLISSLKSASRWTYFLFFPLFRCLFLRSSLTFFCWSHSSRSFSVLQKTFILQTTTKFFSPSRQTETPCFSLVYRFPLSTPIFVFWHWKYHFWSVIFLYRIILSIWYLSSSLSSFLSICSLF